MPAWPVRLPRAPSLCCSSVNESYRSSLRLRTKTFGQSTTLAVPLPTSVVSPLLRTGRCRTRSRPAFPAATSSIQPKTEIDGLAAERFDDVSLGRRVEDSEPYPLPVVRSEQWGISSEGSPQRANRQAEPHHARCRPTGQGDLGDRAGDQRLLGVVAGDRHRCFDGLKPLMPASANARAEGQPPSMVPDAIAFTSLDSASACTVAEVVVTST